MSQGSSDSCRTRSLKITVVGDGNIGKTSLLIAFTRGKFPEEYLPTVFDTLTTNIVVDGVEFSLTLYDTAGQEEYEKLRPLSYPKTDCFLLCYSVDNKSSYANVEKKWMPEIMHHIRSGYCPNAKVLLVGTKNDLMDESCLTDKDGTKMKKKIKANGFLQCSAKTRFNLDEVYQEAVRSIMRKKQRSRICPFL